MRIDENHLYHGAALIQIAEDPHFTAINSIFLAKGPSRSAYHINDKVAVYFKYAAKPIGRHREYVFNFQQSHLSELEEIHTLIPAIFIALVCVKDREICSLRYEQLLQLVNDRKTDRGADEEQYVVLVTAHAGKSFRAYVNVPGKKNLMLGKPLTIARNAFPKALFT